MLGLAAQLSFYFFLALFPAILFLLALASFFPLSNITDDVGRSLGDYEGSYGTVGGVIVVLLWFYVSGIAILTGAELNAEIEHASPYGKAPEQKNAQGKLLIGARAARAFRERQRSGELAPENRVLPPTPAAPPKLALGATVAAAILMTKWWHRPHEQRQIDRIGARIMTDPSPNLSLKALLSGISADVQLLAAQTDAFSRGSRRRLRHRSSRGQRSPYW